MDVITVDCNHCGAPLEVSEKTRFVTCRYCQNRLAIKHSDTSVYTEVLEEIQETTEKLSQDMDVLKLQNQLEQLDREWLLERERHMVTGKHGNRAVPTKMGSVIGLFVVVIFGILVLGEFSRMPGSIGLFPVLVLLLIVGGFVHSMFKANSHDEAEKRYQTHRRQLLSQLNRLRKD